MAVKYGVHPDQAPTLGVDATQEEIQNFPKKIKEWKLKVQEHKDLLLDFIRDEYIDEEQRAKDYQSGRWGDYGYQTPYKPEVERCCPSTRQARRSETLNWLLT